MRKLSLSALVLIVAAASCAAPPTSQDSSAIAARSAEWIAAFQAGDADAVAAFYTADARVLPPNAPVGNGRDEVRAAFDGMISVGLTGTLTSLEATEAGDIGYQVGTYTLESRADGTTVDEGKFIEVWKKVDGEWFISNDMFSSNLPWAPAGALLIATHDVEDGAHWVAAWQGANSRHSLFAENGVSSVRAFQNPDNPDQTGLVIDVLDMDAFMAMLESEEGVAAKAEDGVIDSTLSILAEVPR